MAVLKKKATQEKLARRKLFSKAIACAALVLGGFHSTPANAQDTVSQWRMTNTNVSVDPTQARQAIRMVLS